MTLVAIGVIPVIKSPFPSYCQGSKIGGMQGRPGIFLYISNFAMCTYITTRVKGKPSWFEDLISS